MDSKARSLIYETVCKIADLLESYLSHSSYATDADRWITIGAGKNDWNESTGRHVKIDEHGNIVGGSVPKSAQGKPVNSWWKPSSSHSKSSRGGAEQNSSNKSQASAPKEAQTNNSKIEETIKKYGAMPVEFGPNAGKIMVHNRPKTPAEVEAFKSQLPEIKEYFAQKRAKADAERSRKKSNIASILGLKEIESLRDANEKWHEEFNRSFERGVGGMGVGAPPEDNEKELRKKYPQADAYLRVKAMSNKNNDELSSIGQKALKQFEDDPEKWKEIVSDMDEELKEFHEKHKWD